MVHIYYDRSEPIANTHEWWKNYSENIWITVTSVMVQAKTNNAGNH